MRSMVATKKRLQYLCINCKSMTDQETNQCPTCKKIFCIVKVPVSLKIPIPKKKVASELKKKKIKGKFIPGFEFFGRASQKFYMVIHGAPGGGKSYFAFQLADAIAKNCKTKTIYITGEEDFDGLDFQNKLDECNISDSLYFESIENKSEIQKILNKEKFIDGKERNINIVIDSVSNLEITKKELKNIREQVKTLIIILHVTKDGKYRGTTDLVHNPQVEIIVKKGIAKTGKNRLGKRDQEFDIFKNVVFKDENEQGQS